MSRFDSRTQVEYVEKLRIFLRLPRKGFLRAAGLVPADRAFSGGKRRYPDAAVRAVEAQANAKAARCEARDTTVGERVRIARDYLGASNTWVATQLAVSRELVRQVAAGVTRLADVGAMARVLDVPEPWLRAGDERNLPANSHLGVRLGEEGRAAREQLLSLTWALVETVEPEGDLTRLQADMEGRVFSDPEMARLARRAGGRWHADREAGRLVFVPWEPLPPRQFASGHWPDETEEVIAQELARRRTVWGAWTAVARRCEAAGLPYPKRISLHKRVDRQRRDEVQYGMDINATIAQAVRAARQ